MPESWAHRLRWCCDLMVWNASECSSEWHGSGGYMQNQWENVSSVSWRIVMFCFIWHYCEHGDETNSLSCKSFDAVLTRVHGFGGQRPLEMESSLLRRCYEFPMRDRGGLSQTWDFSGVGVQVAFLSSQLFWLLPVWVSKSSGYFVIGLKIITKKIIKGEKKICFINSLLVIEGKSVT